MTNFCVSWLVVNKNHNVDDLKEQTPSWIASSNSSSSPSALEATVATPDVPNGSKSSGAEGTGTNDDDDDVPQIPKYECLLDMLGWIRQNNHTDVRSHPTYRAISAKVAEDAMANSRSLEHLASHVALLVSQHVLLDWIHEIIGHMETGVAAVLFTDLNVTPLQFVNFRCDYILELLQAYCNTTDKPVLSLLLEDRQAKLATLRVADAGAGDDIAFHWSQVISFATDCHNQSNALTDHMLKEFTKSLKDVENDLLSGLGGELGELQSGAALSAELGLLVPVGLAMGLQSLTTRLQATDQATLISSKLQQLL